MRKLSSAAVLLMALATPATPVHAATNSCAFDYVVQKGLIATEFIETPIKNNSRAMTTARRALPNVQRVFIWRARRVAALVGWARLPEDYSKFTRTQVKAQLRELIEYGKRAIYSEARTSYRFDQGTPLAVFMTLDYVDKGSPYRDVSMDVIATPHCMFSMKFSGPTASNDLGVWWRLDEEFKRMTTAIASREDAVVYAEKGAGNGVSSKPYTTGQHLTRYKVKN